VKILPDGNSSRNEAGIRRSQLEQKRDEKLGLDRFSKIFAQIDFNFGAGETTSLRSKGIEKRPKARPPALLDLLSLRSPLAGRLRQAVSLRSAVVEPAPLLPHALDGDLLTRSIHAKTFEKRSKIVFCINRDKGKTVEAATDKVLTIRLFTYSQWRHRHRRDDPRGERAPEAQGYRMAEHRPDRGHGHEVRPLTPIF
jgi:hypothetical protein